MYTIIFTIPLISAITVGLFGRYIGHIGSYIIIVLGIIFSSILCILGFYEVVICSSNVSIYILPFIVDDILNTSICFMYDPISISFVFVVLVVSSMVYIFSIDYMYTDAHSIRFIVYLCMFSSSMVYLVINNNFMHIFVGWEFIGIFSYYLINFWFKRIDTALAAIKAFCINRIGDVFYTIFIILLCLVFGDTSIDIINSTSYNINTDILYYIGISIILASLAKSAQFGFHIWLPFSMEGHYYKYSIC